MINHYLLCEIAATLPFNGWTPDQWISLGKAWPLFWLALIAVWHRKLGKILDALISFLNRAKRIKAFGVDVEAVSPEAVDSVKNLTIPVRVTKLPTDEPVKFLEVREKLIRLTYKKPEDEDTGDGS